MGSSRISTISQSGQRDSDPHWRLFKSLVSATWTMTRNHAGYHLRFNFNYVGSRLRGSKLRNRTA